MGSIPTTSIGSRALNHKVNIVIETGTPKNFKLPEKNQLQSEYIALREGERTTPDETVHDLREFKLHLLEKADRAVIDAVIGAATGIVASLLLVVVASVTSVLYLTRSVKWTLFAIAIGLALYTAAHTISMLKYIVVFRRMSEKLRAEMD